MTSATPPVATTYSWKDGHTVDVNGTRVIPLIDVKLLDASDADRTEFFKLLRYAVTDVGFLYLKNVPGLNQSFIDAVIAQCHAFFAQPEDAKAEIHMGKSKHFRGWTKLGDERTQYHQNLRENLDLGFELEPVKDNLGHTWRDLFIGPNQWPDETKFPEFKSTMMRYIDAAYKTEMLLIRLILSIFNLPENYLDKYFTFPEREDQPQPFCLCKIAYYPKVEVTPELRAKVPTLFDSDGYLQGCGAHKDNSAMMTVLIQDSPGLEVQAHDGSWIPVPVLPDTVVINIGLPLEEMTHGALAATVHRVNSSSVRGSAGRISVPFFLLPSLDIPLESVPIENVPEDLRRFIGQADELKTDVQKGWNGSITNRADRWIENRLRQNPLVGQEHWPQLWEQYKYDL